VADESGRREGVRRIRGGRADVRTVPYMAAPSAVPRDPVLKCPADRLREAGKAPEVILVAVARKLPVIANAILRTRVAWRVPEPLPATAPA
jgi:transposase